MKTKNLLIVIMLLGTTFGMAQNVSNDTTHHKARSEKDYYWQGTDNGIFFTKGFVGIWTERPESELHVEGQILTQALRIGNFEFPRREGTRDQFLRADGVWAVPAGGGGSTGGGNYWQPGGGSNIYYNAGNVAIGGTTANATFQVTGNMNTGNNPTGTTGINAFVGGKNSIASGNYSFAFGENVKATMSYAFAGGRNTEANNIVAIALGYEVRANATGSVAIGNFVETGGGTSVVIGSGYQTNRLANNIPSSLMIGFKSTLPTFFVSESSGMNATGKIGIGNITAPLSKLHMMADENEAAELRLEHRTTGNKRYAQVLFGTHSIRAGNDENMVFSTPNTSRHFVFQNGKVGIGVTNPQHTLEIAGNVNLVNGSFLINGEAIGGSGNSVWTILPQGISYTGGKVGIGTSNPLAKLEISGTVSVGYNVMTPDGQNNLLVEGKMGIGTFAPTEKLEVLGKIKTNHLQIMEGRYPGYLLLSDAAGNAVWTNPESITNIGPWARQGSFVYVGSNQKVGIGTSQPLQALHVEGNMLLGNNGNIIGNRSSWQPLKIFSGSDENQAHIALYGNYSDAGSIKLYSKGASGQIEFHNATNKILALKADNSIVFGDPDNACAVFVNGELTANQVRVNTGFWWDKVFNPGYPLMPLAELGDFIAKNRHLPEIPNEAEVLDKGVELGEMNGLLLKKIEELTLYLLEQDRKINTLQTELQQIKNAGINN